MLKKLTSLFVGGTLASLGIACIINSGLGCFAVTSANLSIANLTGISMGTAGMLLELGMLTYATYKGEGVGITALVNTFYCSYAIDFFHKILLTHPILVLGGLIIPFGWALMGKAGLGDTGSNILMNALLKQYKKSIGLIRGIEEIIFLCIGLIGASNQVSLFTLFLTFCMGYILQFVYKLIKYNPVEVEHKFIIKGR